MSNVVTHSKFGGAETLERLKAAGVDVDSAITSEQTAEMKLPEPAYGETLLGELTDEEAATFYAMFKNNLELEDRTRTLMGDAITKLGTTISTSDRAKSIQESFKDGAVNLDFDDEKAALEYFQVQQRTALLHATFYWAVGERLSVHHQRLGVRSKLRVVSVERRY